ncbi:MAG: 4Fe-4S binding protein [Oscillospiraceae bacterium]|nr:4Fe-4S binding protein [Oscillospiraceae bacterium]
MITINRERCKGCGLCTDVCPAKIIMIKHDKPNSKGYYTAECTDNEHCRSCRMCGIICPDCAITIYKGGK